MIKHLLLFVNAVKRENYSAIVTLKVAILCILLLGQKKATAQDSISTDLTISSGVFNQKVLDQTISPMIYRGTAAPLHIELNVRGTNYSQRLSASYNRNSLKSSITNTDSDNVHLMDNVNLNFNYSIARKMYSYMSSTHLGGLKISTFLNYRDLTMNRKEASGMTVTADHASSLSVFYNYSLKDFPFFIDMIDINLSTPLLSYILFEGTYHANFNEAWFQMDRDKDPTMELLRHGKFVSLNKFLQIQSHFSLTKRISPRFSTKINYYFSYYSFSKYESLLKVRSLNNAILFGLTYNFIRYVE